MWERRAFPINPDFEKKYPVGRGNIPSASWRIKHQAPNKFQSRSAPQRLCGEREMHGGMGAGNGLDSRS